MNNITSLSTYFQVDTMDNIFLKVLEEMATEANFDRKLAYFAFLQKFIPIHGINCVKRKRRLFAIIVENIDMCTNQPIRKVILDETLKVIYHNNIIILNLSNRINIIMYMKNDVDKM